MTLDELVTTQRLVDTKEAREEIAILRSAYYVAFLPRLEIGTPEQRDKLQVLRKEYTDHLENLVVKRDLYSRRI